MFSNFISSKTEIHSFSSSFEFPIIFFDNYLTLIQRPFKDRFNHLRRVLYKRSNRVILIAVSVLPSQESASFDNIPRSLSCDETPCFQEGLVTKCFSLCNDAWTMMGVIGTNWNELMSQLPFSKETRDRILETPLNHIAAVTQCRAMTADCYCESCDSIVEVSRRVVKWDSYCCPYCGNVLLVLLAIIQGENNTQYMLLTPKEIMKAERMDEQLMGSLCFLCSLIVPSLLFRVSQPTVVFPTNLIATLSQLEAVEENESETNQYTVLQDALGAALLRARGVSVERSTEELEDRSVLIENVSIALLSCSPSRERECEIDGLLIVDSFP